MIIKSMSRKEPSFRQLIEYIDRDLSSDEFCIRHNLMGRNHENIIKEFEENAQLLRKRKNGVFLYHEIISITRSNRLTPREQQELLLEIVQEYISARCPGNLVYGGLHQDKDHSYHFHLMISSNRLDDEKRVRLSKTQFREIQVKLEAHVLEKYPELEQKVSMDKRAEHRRSKGAVEHERRTGRPPTRNDALRGRVQSAYDQAYSPGKLLEALAQQGFRLEPRGKIVARVVDEYTGKAHRVKTLDPDLAEKIEALLSETQKQDETDQGRTYQEEAQETHREREAPKAEQEPPREEEAPEEAPEAEQEAEPHFEEASQEGDFEEAHKTAEEFRRLREEREERRREKALKNLKRKGKPRR